MLTPTMLNRLRQILHQVEEPTLTTAQSPPQVDGQTNPEFKLGDFAIDDCRPMKIIVVGAGMSGILAGIR